MTGAILYYTPKVLPAGEFKDAFERAVAATLGSDATITVTYERNTAEGITDEIKLDAENLRQVVDLGTIKLRFIATKEGSKYLIGISCQEEGGAFRMVAADRESIQCLEQFALYLGLERRAPPKNSSTKAFEEIESRVVVPRATSSPQLPHAPKKLCVTFRCGAGTGSSRRASDILLLRASSLSEADSAQESLKWPIF